MRKFTKMSTDLHQVVKESCIEGFSQGVPRVVGLLLVQSDGDGLRLSAPLGVHLSTGKLVLQTLGVDAQQVGGEGEHWTQTASVAQ